MRQIIYLHVHVAFTAATASRTEISPAGVSTTSCWSSLHVVEIEAAPLPAMPHAE